MTSDLTNIYKKFKTEESCVDFLESILWPVQPVCPYCKTSFFSKINDRYHCNKCNSSFSVTVGTIFHRTRCDFQKWFLAMLLLTKGNYSAREMAQHLHVTKDTSWLMMDKIKRNKNHFELLSKQLLKHMNNEKK